MLKEMPKEEKRSFKLKDGTEFCVCMREGIPSVTYGPGSKYCYWDEEFVPIDEYLTAIKVYAATAARWFGG